MSLLNKASLVLTPNAVKASKLYSVIPTDGTGDFILVRNTTATRINADGLVESVSANVSRLNYDSVGGNPSLLLEIQRTNFVLNSETVVSQSITTTAAARTLTFYGTGTIALSGTFSGSLVGTGANNRVSLTFTPTSGTLTLTISGAVNKGQLEIGTYSTSYIPTTNASATRNQDTLSKSSISNLTGVDEGTFFFEGSFLNSILTAGSAVAISDGTSNNNLQFFALANNSSIVRIIFNANSTSIINQASISIPDIGQNFKIAICYKSGDTRVYLNGVLKATFTNTFSGSNFTRVGFDSGTGGGVFFGKNKSLQVYKTALTDAECITLTTL